jgi:hypothetical protein
MKYFLAVDIEATGQFLTKNAMIGIGSTVMNEKGEEVDNFVGFMKVPNNRTWEQRCVDEFWSKNKETLDYIKERWEDAGTVMTKFAGWLNTMDLKYKKDLAILSNNSGYDFAWIDTYLSEYTNRSSIYYRLVSDGVCFDEKGVELPESYVYRKTWDTPSIFHGSIFEKTGKYEEWGLVKKVECQNNVWENDHNPLNDARTIASNYIIFYNKKIKNE